MAAGELASATMEFLALLSALGWLSLASPTPPLSGFLFSLPEAPPRPPLGSGGGRPPRIYTHRSKLSPATPPALG